MTSLWLLPSVPALAALVVVLARAERRGTLGAAACAALVITLGVAFMAARGGWSASFDWGGALRLQAALTPLSSVVAMLVATVALPVVGFAAAHESRPGLRRLVVLLLLFVGAMELLVIADDLLTLLIGWELVGACSWALIGHDWRDAAAARSANYAFVMTRLGDLGLFLAAMLTFRAAGSFAFADLARLDTQTLQWVTLGLLLSAASKSGQVPFSPWLFRAMAGPTSASALLHAATMVAAGAYLLARLQPELARASWFAPLTISIGLATALAGGVVALLQSHAKKLLAASTSAHFGLMFVAVGAGYPAVAVVHMVVHGCFKALLFMAAGVAGHRAGGYALSRLGAQPALPFVATASVVGTLALAGVPPLGGAWSKEAIVAAAGHASPWLALGVIFAGGLSAVYAARFQWLAFGQGLGFGRPRAEAEPGSVKIAMVALALASAILCLLWWRPAQEFAARLIDASLASGSTWELAASILAVALGLFAGRWLATERPRLGEEALSAAFGDWLQLPAAWHRAFVVPSIGLANALARFDDEVIDALPRAIGSLRAGESMLLVHRQTPRDAPSGRPPPGLVARLSELLARGDGCVVDRGVALAAAFAERFAALGSGIGEWLVDGLPEGLARLVAAGGADARALQGGLTHRYYAIVAVGTTLLFAILWLGT
ncbi:MAG: hypothetical protein J0I65_24990 [Variovorax sp.]|nr:hypothetical protein [Variovorax sp.]